MSSISVTISTKEVLLLSMSQTFATKVAMLRTAAGAIAGGGGGGRAAESLLGGRCPCSQWCVLAISCL
jgi:hypothetical protein